MAKSINIPQEIIDYIIAAVGDDSRSLKQCSLVSSSFLLPSRKQLFSRITLGSDLACQMIHQFLVQNLVIQYSVKAITLTESVNVAQYEHSECQWMNSTSLLAILRLPFRCLERFSINVDPDGWDLKPWNWNNFSNELKDALSNIVFSSNLKILSINGVTRMPTFFFFYIVHLTTLELHSVSPMDFRYEISISEFESLTSATSKEMAPTASHLMVDRCLWHLTEFSDMRSEFESGTRFPSSAYFSLIRGHKGPTISMFLPFMCRLRFLEIYVDLGAATVYDFDILSFLMGSLCISLAPPATLEHLKIDISFRGNAYNADFECETFYEDLEDANVWQYLDSIAIHPSGSQLQRVDINIDYCYLREDDIELEPHDNEVVKIIIDGLPLLRAKDILFVGANSEYSSSWYGPGCVDVLPGRVGQWQIP